MGGNRNRGFLTILSRIEFSVGTREVDRRFVIRNIHRVAIAVGIGDIAKTHCRHRRLVKTCKKRGGHGTSRRNRQFIDIQHIVMEGRAIVGCRHRQMRGRTSSVDARNTERTVAVGRQAGYTANHPPGIGVIACHVKHVNPPRINHRKNEISSVDARVGQVASTPTSEATADFGQRH